TYSRRILIKWELSRSSSTIRMRRFSSSADLATLRPSRASPLRRCPIHFFCKRKLPPNILKITRFCGNTIRSYDLTGARNKSTVAALTQQRPFNQRYVTSIVRWHRIAVVLSPSVGSVNIIFALFWIDIRSVFDGLQKRQPIFFWHVSRR